MFGHLLNFDKILRYLRVNKKYRKWSFYWEDKLLKSAIKYNELEKLIHLSASNCRPILFTLTSGKVFVGTALEGTNPAVDRKFVRISPLMSGYRDKDTHEVIFTVDYLFVFTDDRPSHLSVEDFEVVLPVDQLCASHLFDIDTYYSRFKAGGKKARFVHRHAQRRSG